MWIDIAIRDSNGEVLASMCASKSSVNSAFKAECQRAINFCNELGLSQVIFADDAKAVIDAVQFKDGEDSRMGQIIEDMWSKF